MKGNYYGNLTTESLNEWWELMKSKGAEFPSIAKEDGIYKLHARKHGAKQRLGQKSLGTTDKRIAFHVIETLLIDTSNISPAAVVKQYHEHKLRMVDACRDKERHLRFVLPRIKTAKTNCSPPSTSRARRWPSPRPWSWCSCCTSALAISTLR